VKISAPQHPGTIGPSKACDRARRQSSGASSSHAYGNSCPSEKVLPCRTLRHPWAPIAGFLAAMYMARGERRQRGKSTARSLAERKGPKRPKGREGLPAGSKRYNSLGALPSRRAAGATTLSALLRRWAEALQSQARLVGPVTGRPERLQFPPRLAGLVGAAGRLARAPQIQQRLSDLPGIERLVDRLAQRGDAFVGLAFGQKDAPVQRLGRCVFLFAMENSLTSAGRVINSCQNFQDVQAVCTKEGGQ